MKKAIIYLIEFIAIQLIVGFIVTLVWQLITKSEDKTTGMLITTTVATGVVTIVIFLLTRWAEVSPNWIRTRPWMVLTWSVIAALGALIPSSWLQEQMPELPNLAEAEFDMVLKDRWGYFVVGLLAPLAEELVFRGAVLRALLRWKSNPWVGIVISALLFALIHANPVQMPHAFLVGLLLGWMYYRTDSIVPGVVFHWVNNTVAYVLYNVYPNPDITLLDLFGTQRTVLMALGFSLCIFLPALFQLNLRLKK